MYECDMDGLRYGAQRKMHADSTYVSNVIYLHAYPSSIFRTQLLHIRTCILQLLYILALNDLLPHV